VKKVNFYLPPEHREEEEDQLEESKSSPNHDEDREVNKLASLNEMLKKKKFLIQ